MPRITIAVESTLDSTIGRCDTNSPAGDRGWPVGHGWVPDTLGRRGEPVEALVLLATATDPGTEVCAWPVALLELMEHGTPAEELVCMAEDPCFVDLVDVADLERWHAPPQTWADALARLDVLAQPVLVRCAARAQAEQHLAEGQNAFRRLTGSLE